MMQVRRDAAAVLEGTIDKKNIHRYLKMKAGTKWDSVVDGVLGDLLDLVELRALILNAYIAISPMGLRFEDLDCDIQSLDLKAHLEGEDSAFIVFCSLGEKVSLKIRQEMMLNPSHGVVYDACASEMAEAYAAYLNAVLAENSIRFSPGYGDLTLEAQFELAGLLRTEKHVGIHVKPTGFMHPEKSVCFILGKEGRAVRQANGCSNCKVCENLTCLYRRTNE